jgi:putative mRNA 3-end processing factor
VIQPTDRGLYCAPGDFYIDPWRPVPRAVVTHAHGDHLVAGCGRYLCSEPARALVAHRLGGAGSVSGIAYGEAVDLDGVRVSLHPAGHMLGSAQVRVEHRGDVWVASGDYKRAPDPTCQPFDPQRCRVFITEATFALPIFRWDPPRVTVAGIRAWIDDARGAGRPAVLFAYALGKAQRLLAELGDHGDPPIYVHGALSAFVDIYRSAGVSLPPVARVTDESRAKSFAGDLVVAPVSARGSLWMRRFGDHSAAFASGWMRIRGARRRRAYDRGFALSDHADWDDLVRTCSETGAERVCVTHGYTQQFARYLTERGMDAAAWHTEYEGEPEADDDSPARAGSPETGNAGE